MNETPKIDPKATLDEMLRTLGFTVTIDQRRLDDQILLDIQTDDPGRLIGRSGQTLSELQYLLNRLVFHHDTKIPRIILDVCGYRQQAREQLTKRALETAEKVRRWGDVLELEPMNAYDRWIVHNALKDDPDVETSSVEVEGSDKKVILIRPKRR
ncbi:MAG TPA: KH domain-containing protein [Verrucomicrobiota bacterium]|nr:KH domain-containing protein [Verrucomicrobiota bacterium]